MSEPLFQLEKKHLETGLRGVPVGYCPTSYVDPQKGLHYCSKPIIELADKSPEEVIFLLLHKKEGNQEEIATFSAELAKHEKCSDAVIGAIYQLPREGHPMNLVSAALLILGIFEKTGDYQKDCFSVIAKIPHLIAAVINHHAGWGKTPDPDQSLGYVENFVHMLKIPGIDKEQKKSLIKTLKLFHIVHMDHGGGNLSTFVGKAIASGKEDLFGALCGAMCALSGPLHGMANQKSLEFVNELHQTLGDTPTPKQVYDLIKERLENGKKVCGFGHAVLRVEDPRATLFYDFAERYFNGHPLYNIASLIRTEGKQVLSQSAKISNPNPNVDAISGTVLSAAGFPHPEYFTPLFAWSRVVGISIQIVYERCEAKEGRGTPIIRPKYFYAGNN